MISLESQINPRIKSNLKQDWSIGSTVKVGFLKLEVQEKLNNGITLLKSACGKKLYEFIPHQGLFKTN